MLSVIVSGCDNSSRVTKKDANRFCLVYQSIEKQAMSESMTFSQAEGLVNQSLEKTLESPEFQAILGEIHLIEEFDRIYPFMEDRIEALTGNTWSCEAARKFYTISKELSPDGGKASPIIRITVKENGAYYFNHEPLNLESQDQLKQSLGLQDDETPREPIVIVLEKGVTDELLRPLFNLLAELGIENVNVTSLDDADAVEK